VKVIKFNKTRINEKIRGLEIRVIDGDGNHIGTMPTKEALKLSREEGLDLVEVSPDTNPPVCKIMDYGKYKYQLSKKAHDAKKHQRVIHVKEVKMRPGTEEHDYQFKLKNVMKFLKSGDKVKMTVIFKGREAVHKHLGLKVLERIENDTHELSIVEQSPKVEGRRMTMMLSPRPAGKKETSNTNKESLSDAENKNI
jgi:translation initiation factor IF-3